MFRRNDSRPSDKRRAAMSEQQSLLAAVVADPDDDAVRRVYADWLDENGQPERAEFIRVQIEREKLSQRSKKRAPLEAREKELATAHAKEWLKDLPEWARPRDSNVIATPWDWFGFRRGFL